MDFNKLAEEIHNDNMVAGWWDNPDRCKLEVCQLIVTEISEATEGARKDLMDDKLPHRKMEEVELADILIRTFDAAGKMGMLYDESMAAHPDLHPSMGPASMHFILTECVTMLYRSIEGLPILRDSFYSRLVNSILYVGNCRGYDVISAMEEKREYNKTRADHKRENRAKEGGKIF